MRGTHRFWVFIHGSPVKLKIKIGQSFHHAWSESTDEGWRGEARVWSCMAGDGVIYTRCDDGYDCDGRLQQVVQMECPLDKLQACVPAATYGPGLSKWEWLPTPLWQHRDAWQKDFRAEAAGY